MLGKVENNERRTAAKHNRIHLYLPTAACVDVCVCCSHAPPVTLTHKHTHTGMVLEDSTDFAAAGYKSTFYGV